LFRAAGFSTHKKKGDRRQYETANTRIKSSKEIKQESSNHWQSTPRRDVKTHSQDTIQKNTRGENNRNMLSTGTRKTNTGGQGTTRREPGKKQSRRSSGVYGNTKWALGVPSKTKKKGKSEKYNKNGNRDKNKEGNLRRARVIS